MSDREYKSAVRMLGSGRSLIRRRSTMGPDDWFFQTQCSTFGRTWLDRKTAERLVRDGVVEETTTKGPTSFDIVYRLKEENQ